MIGLFRFIKNQLTPLGTAPIVRLAFSGVGTAAFYNKPYVDSCIDELEKATHAAIADLEPLSPCQRLVMDLLLDSAYIDRKNINESVARFLEWEKKKNLDHS